MDQAERIIILTTVVYQIVLAISIYTRKDIEERWLMPMYLANSLHTFIFYLAVVGFHEFGVPEIRFATWSRFLRMQNNISHFFMLLFIASKGKFPWKE
jgi:small-conductance mechanosensitive channel